MRIDLKNKPRSSSRSEYRHLSVSEEPSPLPGISRNVFLLGLVSLLTDISSEMLYPLIPLYLTTVLLAPIAVIGLIEGLAEATASLLKGYSGWLSDHWRVRKPFTVGGYGVSAFAKPMLALSSTWIAVLFARVMDRSGKGLRTTARDALIADSSKESVRGRAFGFHRSTDQIGAVIGPLLALPILGLVGGNFRLLFLLAFIPAIFGVGLLLLVREPEALSLPQPPSFSSTFRGLPKPFHRFLLVTAVFAVGNSSDAFLILKAKEMGASVSMIVMLFALFNLITVLSSYPAGIISDRLGRKTFLLLGFALFAAIYTGFAFAPSPGWLWFLFAGYGLYVGVSDGLTRAFTVDLLPDGGRGTALGLQATVTGLAAFPSSLIAGLLWQWKGSVATFLFGATLATVAGLLLLRVGREIGERSTIH